MAQVKKAAVREAIQNSALQLFMERGYLNTTLADIGVAADVTVSNIYNYFDSKLDILFAVYAPWLDEKLDRLVADVETVEDPREKLRMVFLGVLRDIPAEDGGFANNLPQALSTRKEDETYSRGLLLRSKEKISTVLREVLPESARRRVDDDLVSHLLFMAFDGFAINYKLTGRSQQAEAISEMLADLILGSPTHSPLNYATEV
jgi:AcrR family transcriptional regulator